MIFTSRMMATPHDQPRPSFLGTARRIYAIDGFRGYFRGLGPTFLRAFPVNASALWVYEGLMRILGAEKVMIHLLTVAAEQNTHQYCVRLDIDLVLLDYVHIEVPLEGLSGYRKCAVVTSYV